MQWFERGEFEIDIIDRKNMVQIKLTMNGDDFEIRFILRMFKYNDIYTYVSDCWILLSK